MLKQVYGDDTVTLKTMYYEVFKRLLARIRCVRPHLKQSGPWFPLHDNAWPHTVLPPGEKPWTGLPQVDESKKDGKLYVNCDKDMISELFTFDELIGDKLSSANLSDDEVIPPSFNPLGTFDE
ncbi:hypothetical protein AVEN_260934-1 [Araneus ventricosus]|uniref:Uncharacterized protein n=1 Tax=Araneus ventricosus TaxID=182803 RepID=A0A4Y2MVC9_ARAVE|nr:hypothetical protein AVEN_260934-1 [Araneus ventricosus]